MAPELDPTVPPRPRRRTTAEAKPPPRPRRNGSNETYLSPLQREYFGAVEEHEALRLRLTKEMGPYDPGLIEQLRQIDALVEVHALGLGYEGTAANGVVLRLTRLRETRGDLSGELVVMRWGNHLSGGRFNASSPTGRLALARSLAQHPAGTEVDWREVLEQFCLRVLQRERRGDAVIEIGTAETQPEAPRVIDPYLVDGPTLLWSPQGSGKSTLAAAIAVSLELYAEVLPGWHPRQECRVLVLDWEASATEWNDRIRRVAAGIGAEPPSVLYRRCRRPLADQVEELAELIDRREVGYLIVDSFEKAAGARSEGSTYDEKAERVFLALDRLARPALLLDHVTGEDLRGGVANVTPKSIGSVLKGAWARATYDLKRDPASTEQRVELLLHNVKVNDARKQRPYEFVMEYDDDHRGPIRFERSTVTAPELMRSLGQAEQIRRVLIHSGSARSVKDLADELDLSTNQVRAVLSRDAKSARPHFMKLPDGSIAVVMSNA